MSDKRVKAAYAAYQANYDADSLFDLLRAVVEAVDKADDHVRVPRDVLRSWSFIQDRPGMAAEMEKYLDGE